MSKDERPAILGGTPVRTKPFPSRPVVSKKAIDSVVDTLKKGYLSHFYKNPRGGEKVQKLEEEFAKYHSVDYAVSVNSGTAALHTALEAAEVKPYSRVLVPTYTFTATATAVLMRGAVPTFIDVNLEDGNISIEGIKKAIDNFRDQITAIIPVHIMGTPANMDEIKEIAEERKLIVIEDACQALGAIYKNRKVGSSSNAGTFSFQESKPCPAGEGGMITTNDKKLAEKAMLIRNHGEIYGNNGEGALIIGRNYRLVEYVAAVALEEFRRIDFINNWNRMNAKIITEAVKKFSFLVPAKADEASATFSRYSFRILSDEFWSEIGDIAKEKPSPGSAWLPRELFIEALKAEGIQMNGGYRKALFEYPLFRSVFYFNAPPITSLIMANRNDLIDDVLKITYPNTNKLVHEQAIWFQDHLYPTTHEDAQDCAKAIIKVASNVKEIAKHGYRVADATKG